MVGWHTRLGVVLRSAPCADMSKRNCQQILDTVSGMARIINTAGLQFEKGVGSDRPIIAESQDVKSKYWPHRHRRAPATSLAKVQD